MHFLIASFNRSCLQKGVQLGEVALRVDSCNIVFYR